MSYRGSSKGSYGTPKRSGGWRGKRKGNDFKRAKQSFERRSARSRGLDLVKMAEIAPSITVYVRAPNRFDWKGVDTVDPLLVFEHKSTKAKAVDLALLAQKTKDVEVWVKNTAEFDLQNVDTPIRNRQRKEKTEKFKVVPKVEAKREAEEVLKVADQGQTKAEKTKGRKLPSKAKILQRATEMFMESQARLGLPSTTPEPDELAEQGLIQRAQAELMRGIDTVVDEQVMMYVDQLKAELEPMGFAIVPLSET